MAENIISSDIQGHPVRRSKRLSIDYEPEDHASNMRNRQALGDITSVHNTHRSEHKKGGKNSANRKLRKTGEVNLISVEENVVLTRARAKQSKTQPRSSRRRSDVAMGVAIGNSEGAMGISELSLAMEEDSECEDSSSSMEGGEKPFLQCSSPGVPVIPQLSLWENETDPIYEYADEIYKNLRDNEDKFLPRDDYMTTMQSDINHTMRSILVDWLVEVGEEYKLSSQTLFLTVNYIDRLLSKVAVNRSKLQLLGITCMLIAAKYEEIYPPSIDEFVYISDNTYTRDEVLAMESVVITSLKFHLSAATPWEFCRRFSQAVDLSNKTKLLADFFCEVFLLEPCSLKYPPSVVASSAMFLALYTLNYPYWTPTLVQASGYEVADLIPCATDLLHAHQKMCNSEANNLKAIREKYKEGKFAGVANIPPKPSIEL